MKPLTPIALSLLVLAGCTEEAYLPEYMNEEIAGHYEAAYLARDDDARLAALAEAEDLDPNNAYTHYVRAGVHARNFDYAAVKEELRQANGMDRIMHYTAEALPQGTMDSLGLVRQIVFAVEREAEQTDRPPLDTLSDDEAIEYLQLAREAGVRLASADPMSSFGSMSAVGIVKGVDRIAEAVFEARGMEDRLAEVSERSVAFDAWFDEHSDKLASIDPIREVQDELDLTDEEASLLNRGGKLDDRGKQREVDKIMTRLHEEEVETLRQIVAEMPTS